MPSQAKQLIEKRREQILPIFLSEELARFKAFGTIVRFKKGDRLTTTGEAVAGMFVLLDGHVTVRERHGTMSSDLTEIGPGHFLAEFGQLTGQPALVDAIATDDVEAILIPSERFRTLMFVGEQGRDELRRRRQFRLQLAECGLTAAG